jgi:bacterial/archaeal transporter family protein
VLRQRSARVTFGSAVCDTPAIHRFRVRTKDVPMASWQVWALLSALFAALTAIFAKLGVEQMNPDVATLIRTVVILVVLTVVVAAARELPAVAGASARTYVFLVLSGLATGASWWCYFRALHVGDAARVAPLDKLSVVLVALFGVGFLGERLAAINWLGILMIAVGAWLVTLRP